MKSAGITYRYDHRFESYATAVRETGVEPVRIPASDGLKSLDGLDGLLLSGGTDIDPALYGEEPESGTGAPDVERDHMERHLLLQALAADVPVLAICRGMQLFNVCHSRGTLRQHVDGHAVRNADASSPVHDIEIVPGSALHRIVGRQKLPVNSRHHQTVGIVGSGLDVSAWAGDGTVEALERSDLRFALAVQWHPEDQIRRFEEQKRLFEAFGCAL